VETNYYEYAAYFTWGSSYPVNGEGPAPVNAIRPLVFLRENRTGNLVTDDRQDGAMLTSLSAEVGMVEVNGSGANAQAALKALTMGEVLPGARVVMQLLSTEPLYYRYTDAVIRQRENRNNPFAEPVLIPTNIQGGLGCFAAYNRIEKIVRLR
jgi:hypothetical protein